MSGGTNQTKPRGTGMPQGFAQKPGAAQAALQDYYNPTTGQTYTHPNLGANPGEGWMAGKPPPGQEYAAWKNPNAPQRQPGGYGPGGGYGGWKPGMSGQIPPQLAGLLGAGGYGPGGGQQAQQFPGMNIPGLLAAGSGHPPGFPGYNNLPKNWQDEGYSWQDPNNPDATYNIIA